MKRIVIILLLSFVPVFGQQQMNSDVIEQSDVVIIACPIKSQEITGPKSGLRYPAPSVETVFKTQTVFKGKMSKNFSLRYWVSQKSEGIQSPAPIPECLLDFRGKENDTFLLFLKVNPDGSYAPVTGQEKPCPSVKVITDFVGRPTNQ